MTFQLSQERAQRVESLLGRYPTRMAACIPVLHLCQEQEGWVSPEIIDFVADRLDMSTSQVKGVATFYTMYHRERVAPNVVWVCRTLSCDLRGAKAIQEHLEGRLGCGVGGTSHDGKVTLLKAECLAACGNAPMVQLNEEYREFLTPEIVDDMLRELGCDLLPLEGEAASGQTKQAASGQTEVDDDDPTTVFQAADSRGPDGDDEAAPERATAEEDAS
jgi:NADH-quinone oxidoreductase subunit E